MRTTLLPVLVMLTGSLTPACGQTPATQTYTLATDDGGQIFYETAGNPNGEPVLMIHGAMVAGSFYPLMGEPALSDFFLIRYHRRGFSGSSNTDVAGREREAADAVAVLNDLNIQRAHVAGHSAGGPIALWLGRYYPDRVSSLILIESPRVYTYSDSQESAEEVDERQSARLAASRNDAADPNRIAGAFQTWWGDDWAVEAPSMIPGVEEQARADLSNQWINGYVVYPVFPDDFFANLEQPVIYLVSENPGDNEDIAISTLSEKLPEMVTRTVIGVPNHGFQMVAPEPTARAISEWIAENAID